MKRRGTIVQYTIEEIRMMDRDMGPDIDWEKVNSMTEEEIERLALEDNRLHGIPDDWYETAKRVNNRPDEKSE